MCWYQDAHTEALLAEKENFSDQAPDPKGDRHYIPPLRPNSVRSNMALPDIPEKEYPMHFYCNPKTGRVVYQEWRTTGKVATRRAGRGLGFRRWESDLLLDAYKFGLSLGATKNASRFRDTFVDAMTEHMDEYGYDHCGLWWPPLI